MAKRYYSRHALNIFTLELEKWEYPLHKHNFFELIFIAAGSGFQTINDVRFGYQKGAIFLLTPEDEHFFEIAEPTTFTYVKFTEQLFLEKQLDNPNSKWQEKIEQVLSNPNAQPQDIIEEETDRSKLFQLLAVLRAEYERTDMFSRQATLELFGAMMLIIARNLHKKGNLPAIQQSKEVEKVSTILAYIRQHITDKEKVKIKVIAEAHLMSPNYVSIFIKKHTGLSIQKLVLETKIKTAERLLRQSNLTISEIAARLGFTDVSHFNKTFKRYFNKTPKKFRIATLATKPY